MHLLVSSPNLKPSSAGRLLLAIAACAAMLAMLALVPQAATAQDSGGLSADSGGTTQEGETSERPRNPTSRARLTRSGRAIAPDNAPRRVKRAIRAANEIRKKPYRYGGGHARWRDRGYDCSGAISYALGRPGARLVKRPLNSSGYMRWGKRGKGRWITVYAHRGHAYVVIAGLRFDTSGTGGKGPRWHKKMRPSRGFKARHPARF